jgi:hypothetical protein
MQKLDKKQLPQVIALGVVSLGLVAWAGSQWLGASGNSASASPKPVVETEPVPPPANGPGGDTGAVDPGTGEQISLGAPTYNPDPFRSRVVKPVDPVTPPAPPSTTPPPPAPEWTPGPLPGPGGSGVTPGPSVALPPPAPVRPSVSVTGIIDVEGGLDMALVSFGEKQQIVQVGDMVDNYRVKKIGLDGVLLVNGKDRYFVAIASTESAPKG